MSVQLDLLNIGETVSPPARRPLSLTQAALRADLNCPPASLQPDEAVRRLMLLCSWLQDHLDDPVSISQLPNDGRQIEVFGALAYRVEPEKREIAVGKLIDGQWEPIPFTFELGRPLSSAYALEAIVERLGLQDERYGDDNDSDDCEDHLKKWTTETAYRLLLRDPAFRRLRRETLPAAFALPGDIYSIALASRARPEGPLLDSLTFNTVWRHERQFRQVARENPSLLPLLMAFLRAGFTLPVDRDPVARLKAAIRSEGHSDAAWRYITRHGSRMFKIPWAVSSGQSAFEVALIYLGALEFSGLPPPPPPVILSAFLHSFNPHEGAEARLDRWFYCAISPIALRAAMLEADKRRLDPRLAEFADEFLGVCGWAESNNAMIDSNQAKAGWPWLVSTWKESEKIEIAIAEAVNTTWKTRLQQQTINGWTVIPLDSSETLMRESLAMRNCLRDYMEPCALGEVEVYSVRHPETGKRMACIGFKFDAEGLPTPIDIKGFANTRAKGEFVEVMGELFSLLQTSIFDKPTPTDPVPRICRSG